MKLHLAQAVRQVGFTMIELLVVIAVIGVLAVAVLSSINPVEQINKGRDTSARSDAQQLLSAIERYYTLQGYFPWNPSAVTADSGYYKNIGGGQSAAPMLTWTVWTNLLASTSEVKTAFITRVQNEDRLAVVKDDVANVSVIVCFLPVSNQFRQQAANNCRAGGTTPDTTAMVAGAFDSCSTTDGTLGLNYICLP